MADKDFLDYDLLIAGGLSPPVANALLTMWERTGAARDVSKTLDQLSAAETEAVWGSISGALSEQSDLQAALDAKANAGDSGETFFNWGDTSGSITLDYQAGVVQSMAAVGNLTIDAVTGWPSPGDPAELQLILFDGNAHTVTLPSWDWGDVGAPTLTAHDRIILETEDGGTNVYARRVFGGLFTLAWGSITGTLSAQDDLKIALDQTSSAFIGGASAAANPDTVVGGDATTSNTDTYLAGAA